MQPSSPEKAGPVRARGEMARIDPVAEHGLPSGEHPAAEPLRAVDRPSHGVRARAEKGRLPGFGQVRQAGDVVLRGDGKERDVQSSERIEQAPADVFESRRFITAR